MLVTLGSSGKSIVSEGPNTGKQETHVDPILAQNNPMALAFNWPSFYLGKP